MFINYDLKWNNFTRSGEQNQKWERPDSATGSSSPNLELYDFFYWFSHVSVPEGYTSFVYEGAFLSLIKIRLAWVQLKEFLLSECK